MTGNFGIAATQKGQLSVKISSFAGMQFTLQPHIRVSIPALRTHESHFET